MSNLIKGNCHCQKSQYEVKGESSFDFICHCHSCQKLNGGGHLSGAMFNKDDFNFSGPLKSYTYQGGSGKNIEAYFCDNCGNHLFAFPGFKEDAVVIKANTFDDGSNFNPAQTLFKEDCFHWDK